MISVSGNVVGVCDSVRSVVDLQQCVLTGPENLKFELKRQIDLITMQNIYFEISRMIYANKNLPLLLKILNFSPIAPDRYMKFQVMIM